LTEEQLRAAVASIEAKGKKGALQVRAAFEQAVAEFAEKRKQKMLIAGAGIAVAAIVGFVLWKRRKA
jgi:LPXTG-motif cell wall-anchored protein